MFIVLISPPYAAAALSHLKVFDKVHRLCVLRDGIPFPSAFDSTAYPDICHRPGTVSDLQPARFMQDYSSDRAVCGSDPSTISDTSIPIYSCMLAGPAVVSASSLQSAILRTLSSVSVRGRSESAYD